MKVFDTMQEIVTYMAEHYDRSKGKALTTHQISDLMILVGVYEEDDLVEGFMIMKDPYNDFKWTLLDSLHADLATRYYIEYISELNEAIDYHVYMSELEYEEEEDEGFYEDLD